MAEQLICNQQVVGSSPITGSTTKRATSIYGQIPERPNGSDCKSDVFDFGGSNPPLPTTKQHLKRGAVLWYVGVLKKHRIIGGSREEARIAKFVPFTEFVADDTLA